MRIFIDIGHPAHVHYFKNIINIFKTKNHSILVSARDKEMAQYLLNCYNIDFIDRFKGSNSSIGKLYYLLRTNIYLYKYAKKFQPNLFIGFGSPYAAQVAFMLRKPSIILDDTENAKYGQIFYKRFATTILSPSTFKPCFGKKHIKFESYMELSYLHPNYFSFDPELLKSYGINPGEKYTIVRFVSWNANHDIGHKGLTVENKIYAVKEFSKHGRVFISSENALPEQLSEFQLKIKPEHIHHVLSKASLFYGESATMASESVVLGTPAVYIDNVGRGYTTEQEERYGLINNFTESQNDQLASITKGVEILLKNRSDFENKRKQILTDKIDLTSFLLWFIENYPDSFHSMKKNPNYQQRFR